MAAINIELGGPQIAKLGPPDRWYQRVASPYKPFPTMETVILSLWRGVIRVWTASWQKYTGKYSSGGKLGPVNFEVLVIQEGLASESVDRLSDFQNEEEWSLGGSIKASCPRRAFLSSFYP